MFEGKGFLRIMKIWASKKCFCENVFKTFEQQCFLNILSAVYQPFHDECLKNISSQT